VRAALERVGEWGEVVEAQAGMDGMDEMDRIGGESASNEAAGQLRDSSGTVGGAESSGVCGRQLERSSSLGEHGERCLQHSCRLRGQEEEEEEGARRLGWHPGMLAPWHAGMPASLGGPAWPLICWAAAGARGRGQPWALNSSLGALR
jgi:hypothetical protein